MRQLFEDVHDAVFCCFRFDEVFQTDGVQQIEIALVKPGYYFQVGRLAIGGDEYLIVGGFGGVAIGWYGL